jgi:hypothetical protein
VPLWRDPTFDTLTKTCPAVDAMRSHLPDGLAGESFPGQSCIAALQSSYKDHGYGIFLYALARTLRPLSCIELGVFQGFSLLSVAAALRDNGHGTIVGFDLFEEYPYRHESHESACGNILRCGLQERAQVRHADASAAYDSLASVDWLHVDLSNDGDTVRRLFAKWEGKVSQLILFEGGSAERDRVDWMLSHGKAPIAPAIKALRGTHPAWRFVVLAPYPSMTLAIRAKACG